MKRLNISGQKFGRLTALQPSFIKNRRTFWLCSCECGKQKNIAVSQLMNGKSKSCGCYRKEVSSKLTGERLRGKPAHNRMASLEAAFRVLLKNYKRHAKARNLAFDLTIDNIKQISQQNCNYCGAPPSMSIITSEATGILLYNGLDRVDSSTGYSPYNVVSCCKICNKFKWDLEENTFYAHVEKVFLFLKDNGRLNNIQKEKK